MLSSNLGVSLVPPKEGRHPFQDAFARMVGDVLAKREEGLQAGVAAARAKLDDVQGRRSELERAEEAAAQDLGAKEEAAAAAQGAAAEADKDAEAARERLAGTEAELAAGKEALLTAESRRGMLSSTLSEAFQPLRDGALDPAKAEESLAAVVSAGKFFSFDATLLVALPFTAGRALEDRSSFDAMVLQQAEAEFRRCATALEETLAEAEPAKREREAKVAEAAAEAERASAAAEERRAAAEAAAKAQKEAKAAKRTASTTLKQSRPELKQAEAEFNSATARLEALRAGPLAAYAALLGRARAGAGPESGPAAAE